MVCRRLHATATRGREHNSPCCGWFPRTCSKTCTSRIVNTGAQTKAAACEKLVGCSTVESPMSARRTCAGGLWNEDLNVKSLRRRSPFCIAWLGACGPGCQLPAMLQERLIRINRLQQCVLLTSLLLPQRSRNHKITALSRCQRGSRCAAAVSATAASQNVRGCTARSHARGPQWNPCQVRPVSMLGPRTSVRVKSPRRSSASEPSSSAPAPRKQISGARLHDAGVRPVVERPALACEQAWRSSGNASQAQRVQAAPTCEGTGKTREYTKGYSLRRNVISAGRLRFCIRGTAESDSAGLAVRSRTRMLW